MKLLELTNNVSQTIASGSPIILGNISRRVGCFSDYSAPATIVTIRESGYYDIIIKANAEATAAAQVLELTLFADGVAVPETLSTHVGTAIGDVETLNINKIIRIFGCSDVTLSLINTGVTDTIYNNIVVDIKKVA
jgi:hypothetical protein